MEFWNVFSYRKEGNLNLNCQSFFRYNGQFPPYFVSNSRQLKQKRNGTGMRGCEGPSFSHTLARVNNMVFIIFKYFVCFLFYYFVARSESEVIYMMKRSPMKRMSSHKVV